ncbi:MAG: DUF2723 domain-containing protein [Candidatus Cloacimonadales bacterium]
MIYKPKSQFINKKINAAVAALVLLGSLLVYYLTLARSLSFWDAGEYITCSSILGVPHPPGNPFYILLGRFISIFSGNLHHAFTVNFLSAIFSALAAMFTYLFAVKLITIWFESKEQAIYAYLGGFISAIFIAFSYTFWTNAIEAEVYSGLAFIINLIAWLSLVWLEKSKGLSHQNILLLIVYIFFLGFGIHQTSLQIAPAVLFVLMYYKLHDTFKTAKFWKHAGVYLLIALLSYLIFNFVGARINFPGLSKNVLALLFFVLLYAHLKGEVEIKTWLFAFFLIIVGLSTHYFLFIRSELRPFINEGNPHNLELFTDYIFRRQYGPTSMFERRARSQGFSRGGKLPRT